MGDVDPAGLRSGPLELVVLPCRLVGKHKYYQLSEIHTVLQTPMPPSSFIFDNVYVINLDADTDKMRDMNQILTKHGISYQRFSGVNGFGIHSKLIKQEKLSVNSWNGQRPGALGCLLSHRQIIIDSIKNKYQTILILEDDCIFRKKFWEHFQKQYNSIQENKPNWELLYLGCSQHGWPKSIKYFPDFYQCQNSFGGFAYALNYRMFEKILELSDTLEQPIDWVYVGIQRNLSKGIAFYPHLITANVAKESSTDGHQEDQREYMLGNRLKYHHFF